MCGYPRCLEYAHAILDGSSDVDRCPPGGTTTLHALGDIAKSSARSLANDCDAYPGRTVARINEHACIGCTLCIAPCPLDAIIGTAKHMHTVISDDCSGCALCVDHCPVDCIEMIACSVGHGGQFWDNFHDDEVERWRQLAHRHNQRQSNDKQVSIETEQYAEIRSEIRSAVNRERSRRWRRDRQSTARSRSKRSAV